MAYDTIEASEDDAQPIELFEFAVGPDKYTYTSADIDVSYNSMNFVAEKGLELDNITAAMEAEQTEITVIAPKDLPLAALFVPMLPPKEITLTVHRFHVGDPDGEVRAWWNGIVVGANFRTGFVELRCIPIVQIFNRLAMRRTFSPLCNHMLYDPDTCRVDPNAFKDTGPVTEINDGDIHVPQAAAQSDGHYTAGFIRRLENGDYRFIISHVGEALGLWAPFEGMDLFETLEIFAGCDHVDVTCDGKFANLVNCGCWPTTPTKNPAEKKFA